MLASVYCRKSTDQTAVADSEKSVARQLEHAKQYAARKDWTVSDEHVYIDDGVSGGGISEPFRLSPADGH